MSDRSRDSGGSSINVESRLEASFHFQEHEATMEHPFMRTALTHSFLSGSDRTDYHLP